MQLEWRPRLRASSPRVAGGSRHKVPGGSEHKMKLGIAIAWLLTNAVILVVTLHSQRVALRDAQTLERQITHLLDTAHKDHAEVFPQPSAAAIVVRIHNQFCVPALASIASGCLALAVILRLLTKKEGRSQQRAAPLPSAPQSGPSEGAR
jgi:hypothetical protein